MTEYVKGTEAILGEYRVLYEARLHVDLGNEIGDKTKASCERKIYNNEMREAIENRVRTTLRGELSGFAAAKSNGGTSSE